MKITAVDDAKDLFLVENIFPSSWLENIQMDLEWQQLDHWPRKIQAEKPNSSGDGS